MSKTLKTIIILAVIAALAFAAFTLLRPAGTDTTGLVFSSDQTDTVSGLDTVRQSDRVVALLQSLNNITLNQALLENPRFHDLVDLGITLPSLVDTGRPNPFRPIGSDPIVEDTPQDSDDISFGDIVDDEEETPSDVMEEETQGAGDDISSEEGSTTDGEDTGGPFLFPPTTP